MTFSFTFLVHSGRWISGVPPPVDDAPSGPCVPGEAFGSTLTPPDGFRIQAFVCNMGGSGGHHRPHEEVVMAPVVGSGAVAPRPVVVGLPGAVGVLGHD